MSSSTKRRDRVDRESANTLHERHGKAHQLVLGKRNNINPLNKEVLSKLWAILPEENMDIQNLIVYCQVRLRSMLRETEGKAVPNSIRTATICDLIGTICNRVEKPAAGTESFLSGIFKSIFFGYTVLHCRNLVPFHELVKSLGDEHNRLLNQINSWNRKRHALEEQELNRVDLLNRSARLWQRSVCVCLFHNWRANIHLIRKQRASLASSWTNLLSLSFRALRSFVRHTSVERLHNAVDKQIQIHASTRHSRVVCETRTTQVEQSMTTQEQQLLDYQFQKEDLRLSESNQASRLSLCKQGRLPRLFGCMKETFRVFLQAQENAFLEELKFGYPQLEILTQVQSSSAAKHPLEYQSVQEIEQTLRKMSDQRILLQWVHFHSNIGVSNFTTSLSNGKAVFAVLKCLFNENVDSSVANSVHRRNSSLLKLMETLEPSLCSFLEPSDISLCLRPDALVAFIARLLCCGLGTAVGLESPLVQQYKEASESAQTHLESIERNDSKMDRVEHFAELLRHSDRAFMEAMEEITHRREIWTLIRQRMQALIVCQPPLTMLIGNFCNDDSIRVLHDRLDGTPLETLDLKQQETRPSWTIVDVHVLDALGVAQIQDEVLAAVDEAWRGLQHVFKSFINSESQCSISFWEYWCLLKSSVFNKSIDDISVLQAFQSTSNESGEIEESRFVELLLRTAKIPVDRAYPDLLNSENRNQTFLQFFHDLLKDICVVDDNKFEDIDPEKNMRRRVLAHQILAVFRRHQGNIASMFLKLSDLSCAIPKSASTAAKDGDRTTHSEAKLARLNKCGSLDTNETVKAATVAHELWGKCSLESYGLKLEDVFRLVHDVQVPRDSAIRGQDQARLYHDSEHAKSQDVKDAEDQEQTEILSDDEFSGGNEFDYEHDDSIAPLARAATPENADLGYPAFVNVLMSLSCMIFCNPMELPARKLEHALQQVFLPSFDCYD